MNVWLRMIRDVLPVAFLSVSCATLSGTFGGGKRAPYGSAIPRRASDATSGSAFLARTGAMSIAARESAILAELRRGNMPAFLRELKPIRLSMSARGKHYDATVFVMPDYLAVGSDGDFVRVPMNPMTAQRVADHFGFILPTKKLVDEIYRQAVVKLTPKPLPSGPRMTSSNYYTMHQRMIESELSGKGHGELTAGHKKDVVITNRLRPTSRRVAIYGWHRGVGRPIQPLSTVHDDQYADYSHGIRLVANMMIVNGKEMPTAEVLQSPTFSWLLSDEGPIRNYRVRTEL